MASSQLQLGPSITSAISQVPATQTVSSSIVWLKVSTLVASSVAADPALASLVTIIPKLPALSPDTDVVSLSALQDSYMSSYAEANSLANSQLGPSAVSSLQQAYESLHLGSMSVASTSTVAKATSSSSVPVSKTSSPSVSSTLGEASSQNTSENHTSTAHRGLSTGAITGIVIGAVLGILLLLGVVLYVYHTLRRMRALEAQMRYEKAELPAENVSWWQRPFTAKRGAELMARNEPTARAE